MRPYDIIVKKRDGKTHTYEEIKYLVDGYTKGEIPDYQVSSWLMASFLNGLNEDETYYLTKAMLLSGKTVDLSFIDKPKVDKHSTGGVGDKISLILAPAVAACGVIVPMTSGRGLGFSGGTLDKLCSIPGYNINLTEKEFLTICNKVGFAMTGQTKDIAPADKKLYELRDVTATVESIPLITSSILSKKFAEGTNSVVMDVKFGSGAFMKTKQRAISLSNSIVNTANKMDKKVICVLTSMDQPLGRAVGNSIEVIESVNCLKGKCYPDIIEVTKVLGGYMLLLAGIVKTVENGKDRIEEKINNGEAFDKFIESVKAQGGNVKSILNLDSVPKAKCTYDVISKKNGYIISINTEHIGTSALFLGAGRFKKEDNIDYTSGILVNKKIGEYVKKGESLATLFYNTDINLQKAVELIEKAYTVENYKPVHFQLIHDIIQ